jgi:hypothetical protein
MIATKRKTELLKKKERTQLVVSDLFEQLKTGVEGIYDSESWKKILIFQSAFRNYSFSNSILISMQCPGATRVASYHAWKKVNRQVVEKGGIKILAPRFKKVKDEQSGEMVDQLAYFSYSTVFDISQTVGDPLPSLNIKELIGNDDWYKQIYETVISISPVPVIEQEIMDGSKGYCDYIKNEIGIKQDMAYQQKAKTGIHEICHYFIHHTNVRKPGVTRNEAEVEAEGTAYVVLSYFDIDTSEYSFPYVAGWGSNDIDLIKQSGDTIQKTSKKIIDLIEKAFGVHDGIQASSEEDEEVA